MATPVVAGRCFATSPKPKKGAGGKRGRERERDKERKLERKEVRKKRADVVCF